MLTARRVLATAATPKDVTFDHYSLMVGGKRIYLWSGEFHYWRLPSPDLWRDVLQKLRAAGAAARRRGSSSSTRSSTSIATGR
jgi:beta-galactosidase